MGVAEAVNDWVRLRPVFPTELLSRGELFIHGTTYPINAIITGNTAKTAFLTTAGHPDILVLREGGRSDIFNFTVAYPEPAYKEVEGYYWPVKTMDELTTAIEELRQGWDAQRLIDKAEEYHIDNVAKLYRQLL